MKKIFLSLGLMLATATAFATTQTQSNQDKPPQVYLFGDGQNLDATTHYKVAITNTDGTVNRQFEFQSSENYNHVWVSGLGGNGSRDESTQNTLPNFYTGLPITYADSVTGSLIWDWSGLGEETDIEGNYTNTYTISIFDRIGNEHCDVNDTGDPTAIKQHKLWLKNTYMVSYSPKYMDWDSNLQDTYTRTAQTVWHVQTGGKAVPRQNLWQFSGSASEILSKRSVPPFYGRLGLIMRGIDPTQIQIMGKYLNTNGVLYTILPDGQDLDVTPQVKGKDFYTFGVGGQKYHCQFTAYVLMPDPPPGHNTHNGLTDWGHAWWCLSSDAPVEAFNQFPPTNRFHFVNEQVGYADHGLPYGFGLKTGVLRDPETDSNPTTSKTYDIGFDGLLSGLSYTQGIKDNPGIYSVTGNNCVQHVVAAGAAAGLALPHDTAPETFGWDLINSQ